MQKSVLIFGHNDAPQFIDIYNQYTQLFDKNKYKITVVYLTSNDNESARERTITDNVVFLNMPGKKIRGLKLAAIRKMFDLTRKEKFDIVICHRYKPSYIMLWVAQFHRISAMFFIMHELNTMTAIGRRLLIACLKKKNMLFAGVSNAVRDNLRKSLWFIPKNKVITLYNVMDTDLTEPQLLSDKAARETLGLSPNDFIFANLARLVPNKDHETLINAFAKIKPDCPRAKLLLVGDGILEETLKNKVKKLNLSNDIIFTGFVKNAFRYMRGFDCFVLTSKQEAFGRVLLEAMIAKLPIIATRANGIPEVMGNQGTLIPVKSESQLIESMLATYQAGQDERLSIGEKAYQHLMNSFSIPCFKESFWTLPLMERMS